jgi:hypothetical protein
MQGKVEKFHLGINQSMSHYVKYGNDWDEFINYALMAREWLEKTTELAERGRKNITTK